MDPIPSPTTPRHRAVRHITWLGHATVALELDGVRLLTDPVLGTRLAHLRRHAPAPAVPRDLDAVLISHVHRDHLDRPSLRAVAGRHTDALTPAGSGRLLRGLPFAAVHELRPGEAVGVRGLDVRAVPAWHDARRDPWSKVVVALGFVAARVWFAGDTGLHPDLADLRGQVDVALVPIWGWGTSLGPGHLDPEAAARAVALVAPDVVVPIHWGTFLPYGLARRHGHLLRTPPADFARHVARLAPGVEVVVLTPGESFQAGA